jgi:glycosyltransferase involved in cell wall biosynthesis
MSLPIALYYPEIQAFGGQERLILVLSRYLHRLKLPYEVVVHRDSIQIEKYADFPLVIRRVNSGKGLWRKARAIRRYLAPLVARHASRPLIIGLNAAVHMGFTGLSGYGAMISDPPSFATPQLTGFPVYDAYRRVKGSLYLKLAGPGLRRADLCITNARFLAAELDSAYGTKFRVIYPGGKMPAQTYQKLPQRMNNPIRFLSISRLEHNKRIDWILESAAELLKLGLCPALHLDIVGDGAHRNALQRQAAALDLGSSVTFHGFVNDEKLESLYSAASLFVMPAVQGFGLPALEALYRQVPVVMHVQSGVSEILAHCPWVICFSGGTRELTNALKMHLDRSADRLLDPATIGTLPTEETWAREIVQAMDWHATMSSS